jgi:hypothetical protein
VSRSNYNDDCDQWSLIRWRGAVMSAINGKRGQGFLRELLAALDMLPQKRLIAGELECDGEVCALGAVGRARGLDMTKLDPEDIETVAPVFGIPDALAREIVFMNDDECFGHGASTEERWKRMRAWAANNLKSK